MKNHLFFPLDLSNTLYLADDIITDLGDAIADYMLAHSVNDLHDAAAEFDGADELARMTPGEQQAVIDRAERAAQQRQRWAA